ncbi:MAG: NAD(P)/FAD-dependent oxidoreductase [Methylibium sp.]|uniref:NAD(P)/FAD-dependent oxidoreductase n=1 Tax=Methylibium sp. TaxID=2067992 RepID=UPI0017BBE453|nr:NAD(P)/FAD-dependent oxidoreductase [Methylibium sp.]MBA3596939.1 NAD(P)/FAD-dependent oxidoreductase [Methylibium sp.]
MPAAGGSANCDALIVGGGPAGLTGAIYLARFRRRVLVIDEGTSRAASIPRSHNVPGYPEGVVGGELVAAMRSQAVRYGARFAAGCVQTIEADNDGFIVRYGPEQTRARTVLLASGASDVTPPMPHLSEALRSGALRYCPVCDGFEVIDQRVGVVADSAAGIEEALYLRHFTPYVTIFRTGPALAPGAADRRRLARSGVVLVEAPIESIRLWQGHVTVRHGAGETECDALYSALGLHVHSELGVALGAKVDGKGYLVIDRHQRTTVQGLYAAGDVARGLNQISVAAGGAAIAAAAMHLRLGTPIEG